LVKGLNLKELLQQLKRQGLEGVEVDYGYRRPEDMDQIESIREMSEEIGLIATGGSDFHGDEGHYALGSVGTSLEIIDQLREACKRIRVSSSQKL
jgi:predicted metal-dependent phosphoesterase TrpH